MTTLQDILIESSSYLDLATDLPVGDELDTRINYGKQAVKEWESAYKWKQLNKKFYPTLASLATIPLPTDFRDLLNNPQEYVDGYWQEHVEVNTSDVYNLSDPYFMYIQGNDAEGYNAIFNKRSGNATMVIDYQSRASTMATLTDVCVVPDSDFVKWKVISLVLQSRLDERFPIIEAKAQQTLANMIGREQSSATSSTKLRRFKYHLGSK